MEGKLYIVGVGPGNNDHMTFRAKEVIEESDTIYYIVNNNGII